VRECAQGQPASQSANGEIGRGDTGNSSFSLSTSPLQFLLFWRCVCVHPHDDTDQDTGDAAAAHDDDDDDQDDDDDEIRGAFHCERWFFLPKLAPPEPRKMRKWRNCRPPLEALAPSRSLHHQRPHRAPRVHLDTPHTHTHTHWLGPACISAIRVRSDWSWPGTSAQCHNNCLAQGARG